ncbi:hypothetical protein E2P81_ATG00448 [Venturia nashicola]|uniref:Uncharacterized protein n=1 Tax=Venturia nashicola TaxID=86259 RepID=A0A4Z1PDV3_9PEZI|nr:hypothetical protein E6O75_ATG00458 [Venturia nashicola]TLD39461.1 hypothetical protein E2P81_ATG00448 [Venturia nashicola]
MFAPRVDQENTIHAHQQAAASKPLNQGLKGLAAKTPARKIALNDENATDLLGGKTRGKGLAKNGGGKLDKSAFVTPAGPRTRAPLGMKTTNAKANFRTPAPHTAQNSPEKSQQKTVSPRLRRAKVKVLQGEVAKDGEAEEREIEYMPPRAKALPDYPSDDEFGPEKTFPQLAPENLTRGWPSVYFNPVDDNGVSLLEKKAAEQDAAAAKYEDELLQKAMDEDDKYLEAAALEELSFDLTPATSFQAPRENPASPDPPKRKLKLTAPPTIMSKSAAAALSNPSKPAVPSFSAPTAAAKARVPLGGVLGRKVNRPATETISARRTNTTSHNTLGYAKGRAASSNLKKPLTSIFKDGSESHKSGVSSAPPVLKAPKVDPLKELEDMIHARDMGDDEDDLFGNGGGVPLVEEDDEYADFQMKMPSTDE